MLSEIKLKVLEEISNSFSRDEVIWASGYLAGRAASSAFLTEKESQQPNDVLISESVQKITLAYGTETGNAKKLAMGFSAIAKKKGFKIKLEDLAQYKTKDLSQEAYFFIITSTQGDGEPPFSAKKFYDYIHENELDLSHLKFGILGLGDSSYPQFCKTAEDIDTRLESLGAQRVIPLKKCDVDYEEEAPQWLEDVFSVTHNKGKSITHSSSSASSVSGIRKKYKGKVSTTINLNDITSDKETYHIELDTEEPVVYKPGDALGVVPFNSRIVVEEIINLTEINPRMQIETPRFTASVFDLLHEHLNISYLQQATVSEYARITGQDIPEIRLSLLDLLRIYPVKNVSEFEEIIKILSPQIPRLYSISSSPEAHGNQQVHITVAKSEFFINDKKYTGLCSGFLSGFKEGECVGFYIQEAKHFKLPDTQKDIIMIGPGTGVAPFRSFLWERDALGAEGRNWLFFGDRHFLSDFLYQSDFQYFLKTGVLTHLDLAFSRDTAEKIYVQHRLQQKANQVFQWLQAGAYLYVCGARNPMSKEVEETLLDIIQHQGKLSKKEALKYLEELEVSGRYTKDVY
ncbi:sulfite reductase [Elizabethkingia argentiflava]|uniref:assimilatory sulfite reductase (NADPH) n=1 Tax=Elizabethkingia argenteiflava TaxID=2681556 RepID=A0A845PVE0_9FLAO|nr:flavodoxin domain-containing protein [Elizabethkingia argenteiflava]NAW50447.1 sulfite reductase [Elizabethkingia argenteiflava]